MTAKESIFAVLVKDIERMRFSVRVINDCKALGIKKVFELVKRIREPDSKFLNIFGQRSISEIKEKLFERGIDEDDLKNLSFDEEFINQLLNFQVIYSERKYTLAN